MVAVAALVLGVPVVAHAEAACPPSRAAGTGRSWPAPLDRTISLRERDNSLRNVLGLLAAAARLRLSYASELLPLERRVCAAFDSISVGDALAIVLSGTTVEPVVAGANQVVLAPLRPAASAARPAARSSREADVLERIVVTGSAAEVTPGSAAIASDVLSGRQLAERGATSIAEALDGAIPGVWVWEQSPASMITRYASIRGASSFGVSSPKIYIDGVEVANPLLLTQMSPESVDRIEVIRGPQGAAIYGADAISGVINITTRHDGVESGGRRLTVRSTAGMSSSEFAPLGVVAQEHALTLRGGTDARSAGLGLSLNTLGAYVPGAASRQLMGTGDLRVVGSRTSLTAFARLFSQQAGSPTSPLLQAWQPSGFRIMNRGNAAAGELSHVGPLPVLLSVPVDDPQTVRQYTLGATGTLATDGPWTQTLVFGVDGYRLRNVDMNGGPIPSASDSALRAARGSADRASFRATTTGRFGTEDGASSTVVVAAEQSVLREATLDGGGPLATGIEARRSSTGFSAQLDVAVRRSFFVTGGLRLERDAGYTLGSQIAALPMLGGAYVVGLGPATLKLRTAYGKAIRPARTTFGGIRRPGVTEVVIGSRLAPEQQAGIEAGADLLFGRRVALHVTRFDQRASGLVQPVTILEELYAHGAMHTRRIAYQLQNVGEIANRGWEVQGSAGRGPLSLAGAFSLVDSRVARLASGYTGDLRAGDRMLEVPARTASVTATWNASRWLTSWTVARASDWVNYDRLSIAQTLATSTPGAEPLIGDELRGFWRQYGGVTRLRATASRDLFQGLSLVATGDNLLGLQRGEPDNITIVPGRTITLGIRAKF